MKHLLCKTVLSLLVLSSGAAFAADGYVTSNVYLRAGPDAGYPGVVTLNAGTPVVIEGSVNGWSWCDVEVGDHRGWVNAAFLQDDYRGQRVAVPQYGVEIGIPIVSFVFATYWQEHYRNKSWYSQRQRWSRVQPRYRMVVGRSNVRDTSRAAAHGNPRDVRRAHPTSHTAATRARAEPHRTALTTASTRSAHPTRTVHDATPVQSGRQAKHNTLQVAHNAASPQPRVAVSYPAPQRTKAVARHQPPERSKAQQKKPAQKSKQDKNKRPDSSGQQ